MDWQPYDHVGWRLVVPGVGSVEATVDLGVVDGGTRVQLRWDYLGEPPVDAALMQRIRIERDAAFGRLASIVGGALPVMNRSRCEPVQARRKQ